MRTAVLILFLSAAAPGADPAVLEKYSFHLGTAGAPEQSPGAELRFSDRFFGGGTARSRISLLEESSSSGPQQRPMMLFLQVARDVQPGELVFALLVFRVEIRAYDGTGTLLYSRDLPGFTFRDSAAGRWHERLSVLPTAARQLEITFFGNYE